MCHNNVYSYMLGINLFKRQKRHNTGGNTTENLQFSGPRYFSGAKAPEPCVRVNPTKYISLLFFFFISYRTLLPCSPSAHPHSGKLLLLMHPCREEGRPLRGLGGGFICYARGSGSMGSVTRSRSLRISLPHSCLRFFGAKTPTWGTSATSRLPTTRTT